MPLLVGIIMLVPSALLITSFTIEFDRNAKGASREDLKAGVHLAHRFVHV